MRQTSVLLQVTGPNNYPKQLHWAAVAMLCTVVEALLCVLVKLHLLLLFPTHSTQTDVSQEAGEGYSMAQQTESHC